MINKQTLAQRLEQWQEMVWLLIALLTPLFVNLWVEQQFEASKVWLLRTLVLVLIVLFLAGLAWGDFRPKSLQSPIRNTYIILIFVMLLATLLSPTRWLATWGSLDRANGFLTQASYFALFYLVASQLDKQKSERLLTLIVLTALPICLLALAQAVGWQPLSILTDSRSPLATTLGRSNFTGAYLALLFPLTIAATQLATVSWQRMGYGGLLALQLGVIGLTQARAAWISVAVGVLVLLWLRFAPYWTVRTRLLVAFSGASTFAGILLLILQRGLASGGSIAARWAIWQASLRLLWPRLWLGYGADTLALHFPAVYPPQLVYYQGRTAIVDRAHNWLLDWSLNYGVVATIIFILLIVLILWQASLAVCTRAETKNRLPSKWLAATIASVCAHLVGNLFLFDVAATATLFWLLLAVLVAATGTQPVHIEIALQSQRAWKGLFLLALPVAGWLIWVASIQPLLADMAVWRGTRALSNGQSQVALANYQTAVRWQPRRAAYYVAEGLTAAQRGDFVAAESTLQIAISLRPTDPTLYQHLATIYAVGAARAQFDWVANAYTVYEEAIVLAPTVATTYREYADLALRTGDGVLALAQAQQAVELDATDGISFGIIGWVQLGNSDPAAAQAAFEQAVKWVENSADFHLGLATAYYQLGDLIAAQQALEISLKIDPTYSATLELQRQLQNEQ